MRLLLDTHVWLWWLTEPGRLPARTAQALRDVERELLWSSASVWELAVKHAIGKLRLPGGPEQFVASRLAETGAMALPISHRHALAAAALPAHHRDPFDRLLVAQAQVDGLTLVTGDPQLTAYDVAVLWD